MARPGSCGKGLRKIQPYLPEWDGVRTGEIEGEVRSRLERVESGGTFSNYPRIAQTRACRVCAPLSERDKVTDI